MMAMGKLSWLTGRRVIGVVSEAYGDCLFSCSMLRRIEEGVRCEGEEGKEEGVTRRFHATTVLLAVVAAQQVERESNKKGNPRLNLRSLLWGMREILL